MGEFVNVAKKSEFKEGQGKSVDANGKKIALFYSKGKFYAIDNTCKHMGGPLGEGELEDSTVTCPWHGWRYNIETGANLVMPNIKVNTYNVKVEDDDVKVEI